MGNSGAHLKNSHQNKRAAQFIYRAFLALPLPTPSQKDFWDEVPEDDIPAISTMLANLAYEGFQSYIDEGISFYHNHLPFYLAYMFVDKLARRNPDCHLKDFITPFYCEKLSPEWDPKEKKLWIS